LPQSRNGIQDAAIFEELSPDDLKLVLSRASVRAAPKGAFLFRQGEPAREMFLLESGCVRLKEITADGRELLIRFVRPGEVCGDKAAIAGAEYGASAVSETPVRAYAWTTGMIMAFAKGSAPARNEPVRHHDTLFALLARTLPSSGDSLGRVPNSLGCGRLGPQHRSSDGNATIVITGRAVQQDIADLAATTIYTVNRVLSGL